MRRSLACAALCWAVLVNFRQHAEAAPAQATHPKDQVEREQTTFELDGHTIVVRHADTALIRAQLMAHVEQQHPEHRDALRASTRGTFVRFMADSVQISGWYLEQVGNGLRVMIRLGPGASPAYAARVRKLDRGWRVEDIRPVHIHAR